MRFTLTVSGRLTDPVNDTFTGRVPVIGVRQTVSDPGSMGIGDGVPVQRRKG